MAELTSDQRSYPQINSTRVHQSESGGVSRSGQAGLVGWTEEKQGDKPIVLWGDYHRRLFCKQKWTRRVPRQNEASSHIQRGENGRIMHKTLTYYPTAATLPPHILNRRLNETQRLARTYTNA